MAKTKLTQEVIDLFWLLANPTRLRITELLGSERADTVDELSEIMGLNPSTVAVSLYPFRNVQVLLNLRKEGRRVHYGLDRERVASILYDFADAANIDLSKRPAPPPKKKSTKKKKS